MDNDTIFSTSILAHLAEQKMSGGSLIMNNAPKILCAVQALCRLNITWNIASFTQPYIPYACRDFVTMQESDGCVTAI